MGNIFVIGDAPFVPNANSFISKDGQTSIQLPINESGYAKLVSDLQSLKEPDKKPVNFDFRKFLKLTAIYWVVKLFYSKIYFEGDFAQKSATGSFSNVDITKTNENDVNTRGWFRKANIDDRINSFNFTASEKQEMINCARSLCQYPQCVKNTDGTYTISIFVPYTNLNRIQEQDKDLSIFQNKINRFLRDAELLITNTGTNTQTYGKDCVLGDRVIQTSGDTKFTKMLGIDPDNMTVVREETYGDIVYYQNDGKTTNELIKLVETTPIGMEIKIIQGKTRFYPFVSKCSFKINKWSPMLGAYFDSSYGIPLSDSIYQSIIKEQNVCLNSYFEKLCLTTDCLESRKKFCSQTITLPSTGDPSIFFVSQLNSNCLCINSLATPASSLNGNITGMCFDKNCSAVELASYGITDEKCNEQCGEISSWVSNKIPLKNPSNVDSNKLSRICSVDFKSDMGVSKNNDIVELSYILMVLFVCLFLFQTSHFDKKKSLLIAVVYICICFIVYSVLSIELKGESRCADVNKAVCYSKNNYEISDEFCEKQAVCECMFDEDCGNGNGCRCASGICVSTGSSIPRETENKNVYLPKLRLLIFCLILSITFFMLFRAYNPNVFSSNVYFMITILLCVIPLGFGIYKNQTQIRQETIGKCCTPNCAGKKAGDDNGCGGVC